MGLITVAFLLVSTTVVSSVPQSSPDPDSEGKFKHITCPFLASLVHEGKLPLQTEYTYHELLDITVAAGGSRVDPEVDVKPHVARNFALFGKTHGKMNIFKMDGYPNEHRVSTGIVDCRTNFGKCERTPGLGPDDCPDSHTEKCHVPNEAKFESFWKLLHKFDDSNVALLDRVKEVAADHDLLEEHGMIVDHNPIYLNPPTGWLAGWDLLLRIFGESEQHITKESLRLLVMEKTFPPHYIFPGGAKTTPTPLNTSVQSGAEQEVMV